jgi:non-homologous end joining protein Ku
VELVVPPNEEHPQVINLMDALKKSVAKTQAVKVPTAARKAKKQAGRKMAPSARQRKPAKRRKKMG